MSVESRLKMAIAKKGIKRGPHAMATREKISASQKGKVFSADTLAKMSAIAKGRHPSAEAIEKTAAARRGTLLPKEHKERISSGLRAYHAKHRFELSEALS